MVLLAWNIRGLNGSRCRREILLVMAKFRLEIVGLMEIRVCRRNQNRVMKIFSKLFARVSNSWAWESKTGISIWVLWNPSIWNTKILIVHKQFIHIRFCNNGGLVMVVTYVYGRITTAKRKLPEHEIPHLSSVTISLDIEEVTQRLKTEMEMEDHELECTTDGNQSEPLRTTRERKLKRLSDFIYY